MPNGVSVPIEFVASFDAALKQVDDFGKQANKKLDTIGSGLGLVKFDALLNIAGKVLEVFEQLGGTFKDAIVEAAQAEESINRLGLSLKASGDYSEQNVEAFKSFAEQLSLTSRFTDDQILSQVALAKQFNVTNTEATKLIAAATELSAATGKDLATSVQQLGQTLEGTSGRLGRTIPSIHNLTEEQLKAGAAIDIVSQRFKGFAEGELGTFNGRLNETSKAFTELLKSFGDVFVSNDSVKLIFQAITQGFRDLTVFLRANGNELKLFVSNGLLVAVQGFNLLATSIEIVNDILYLNFKLIVDAGKAYFDFKTRNISGLIDAFKDAKDTIVGFGNAITGGQGLGPIGKVLSSVEDRADSLADKIAEVVVQQERVADGVTKIKKSFDAQVPQIEVSVKELLDALKLGIDKPFGDNTSFLVPLTKGLKSAFQEAIDFFGISLGKKIKETDVAKGIGSGISVLTDVTSGAAGVSKLAGAFADSFVPGLGGLVQQLGKGPEAVKQMVDDFAKALPDFIENLIKAVPVLIEAIANDLPEIIQKLVDDLPQLIGALIASMPRVIGALVALMPRVVGALVGGAAQFVGKILEGAFQFVGQIIEGAGKFVEKLLNSLTGGIFSGGGKGGLFGGSVIPGILEQVQKTPQGLQQNQTSTAREASIRVPQTIEVPVRIGNSEFARAIIDVKRLGFRLEPA